MSGSLSGLSDADLQALYNAPPATAPQAQLPASPLGGMTDVQLRDALNASHPVSGPSGSLLTDAGRQVGTALANTIGGVAALPHLAAEGVDWAAGLTGQKPWLTPMVDSLRSPTPDHGPLIPDFQNARDRVLHSMGATQYVPETWLGRRTQDVLSGIIGGGAGGLASGGPRAALASIPAAAGAAATGGQAAEAFPEHPLAAALIGAIPGAAIGSAAMNAPQRVGAMMGAGTPTEPYGAFQRLGLPTDLAGTTTGAPGLAYAEKLAARMPGSEGAVADARNSLVDAWQNKLGSVADNLGSAATPQEAGTSLQSAAKNWLTDFKAQSGAKWGDFWNKVPPTTPVPATNYQAALTNTLGAFPGASETAGVLQPGTVSNLSKALNVDLAAGGGSLPMQALKSMRTAIGEKLDNPMTIADTSQAALKQLYGGLTRDIETGAGSVSPDALTAFHRANGFTAAGHDLLENHLNGLLTAPNAEQATQYALSQARQGGSRLGAITNSLPGAAGDLRSLALRQAATNMESPTSMATALTGRKPIYSPEAQNILFNQAGPGVAQDVADLAATGNAMKPFEKDFNNSPTATHQARGIGRILAAAELAKQGHELGGHAGAVAGGALGLLSPGIIGRAAQVGALNPMLAALYGNQIPMAGQSPSLIARALMTPAIAAPRAGPLVLASPTNSPTQ